jgi:hypothetical protein
MNNLKVNGETLKDNKYTLKANDVKEGETVKMEYIITNTSDKDLMISSVSTSCGCTDADYDRAPIKTGQDTIVTFSFNSMNKKGFNVKSGTMYSNFDTVTLKFEINVI